MTAFKQSRYCHPPIVDDYLSRLALICVWICAVIIYLKNAWISDDAYILFRSIEQLYAGHGPVWNPHQRVQVFTSPLWYGLMALGRGFSSNLFLVSITLSLLLFLSLLIFLWRFLRSLLPFAIVVLMMLCSNAFFDFTSSGLENILAYVLIAYIGIQVIDGRAPLKVIMASGVLVTVRHDLILLVVPSALWITYVHWLRYSMKQWIALYALAILPLFIWTLFSLIYYGVPVPNTAYAKLATGWSLQRKVTHGLNYLRYTLCLDSITALMMMVAGGYSLLSASRWKHHYQVLMMGALCYVIYCTVIGGDFMAGRFYSYPYLMSSMIIAHAFSAQRISYHNQLIFLCGLIAYGLFYFHTPLNSPVSYRNSVFVDHIADERGYFHFAMSLKSYLKSPIFPDAKVTYHAMANHKFEQQLFICSYIGIYGYKMGVDKIIIDPLALSDPFLSKLPASKSSSIRVGHFARQLPRGYLQSIHYNKNLIEDPYLADYYQVITILTEQKPLLSWQRLKTIARFNLGAYDQFLEKSQYYPGIGESFSCYDTLTPLLAKYY